MKKLQKCRWCKIFGIQYIFLILKQVAQRATVGRPLIREPARKAIKIFGIKVFKESNCPGLSNSNVSSSRLKPLQPSMHVLIDGYSIKNGHVGMERSLSNCMHKSMGYFSGTQGQLTMLFKKRKQKVLAFSKRRKGKY